MKPGTSHKYSVGNYCVPSVAEIHTRAVRKFPRRGADERDILAHCSNYACNYRQKPQKKLDHDGRETRVRNDVGIEKFVQESMPGKLTGNRVK